MSPKRVLRRLEITNLVWVEGGRVFKRLPKFNADNEMYFLALLEDTGYVPTNPIREEIEVVSMEYIRTERVTDPAGFMSHYARVIDALRIWNVRHGDLTVYSVLVRNNKPVIIDFAESRVAHCPIPSKRPEGDSYWLGKTMEKLSWNLTNVHQISSDKF